MTDEEEAAYLSRIIGMDREKFIARINAKLKQRSRELLANKRKRKN